MIGRLPLRWKVPGIIALILTAAMVTLAMLAYRAARQSAVEIANERLLNATERISGISGAGVANVLRLAESVAKDPAVVAALKTPGAPLTRAARAALDRTRTDTSIYLDVALVDLEGRPVGAVTPEPAREGPPERFAPIDRPAISPFRLREGKLEYVVSVPVLDSGQVVGQLIERRRVTRVTASLRVISDLIGPSAILLIGNSDGGLSAELSDTTAPPVIRDSVRMREARERNTSASATIPGTPWSFSVEYPYEVILRPLRPFSGQSILVAIGVVLLAMVAGKLLSRGITKPLRDLTTTAEFIAGGDLSLRPVAVTRHDEIGRLARSFHTMAESIRDSRDLLERRIEARTADLQSAMTRLRDTQDELVRKERLAMLGQLSSSIGHELRNPLGVMSNAVYILEETLEAPTKQTLDYLRLLKTQIKLSERIVADLLDSVRSQSPQRRRVEVDTLLSEQLQRVTVPKNVTVDVSVEDNLCGLHVDPDQVGQILVNLFTNALQAIGGVPGKLVVRASNGNGRIRIEVRDTGPGVPVDMRDKIFEPLYTTKARGIGLGLAVSRSLATANLGSLSVVNHAEGGAVFVLDLPAGESE